jgi:hypothetical protein
VGRFISVAQSNLYKRAKEGKVNFQPHLIKHHATVTCMTIRDTVSCTRNFGTRWRWVTSLTLSERGSGAPWIGGWDGTKASLGGLKERKIPNSAGKKLHQATQLESRDERRKYYFWFISFTAVIQTHFPTLQYNNLLNRIQRVQWQRRLIRLLWGVGNSVGP